MAESEHARILCQGAHAWNTWRADNADVTPDLRRMHIPFDYQVDGTLEGANFRGAKMSSFVGLGGDRDWSGAIPSMSGADFTGADLTGATFFRVNFRDACFRDAILDRAEFEYAHLERAQMIGTSIQGATFRKVGVYGIAAWDVASSEGTVFEDVLVSGPDSTPIEVDHLDVAQFIYMLVHNPNIRRVLDTVTAKAVLILGRFSAERKEILDRLRTILRQKGYVPILFDFSGPTQRDLTETISTLAHLSKFVVADITDAKSIPQELMAIVPNLPSVPLAPLIQTGKQEYAMFEHFRRYPWVLPIVEYANENDLIERLDADVVAPLERRLESDQHA